MTSDDTLPKLRATAKVYRDGEWRPEMADAERKPDLAERLAKQMVVETSRVLLGSSPASGLVEVYADAIREALREMRERAAQVAEQAVVDEGMLAEADNHFGRAKYLRGESVAKDIMDEIRALDVEETDHDQT